jgi:polysaccharide biosynthesis protein PslE
MAERFELELHSKQAEHSHPRYEVGHFFGVLYRHKWKVIAVFTTVVVSATLFTVFSKRVYRAEGKLFVRLGRENSTLDPTATLGQASAIVSSPTRENEINSLAELLRSQGLIEHVVDEVGPNAILGNSSNDWPSPLEQLKSLLRQMDILPELTDRDQAIIKFEKNLKVEVVAKSNVIVLTYEGSSRKTAQLALNTLIDLYLKQHGELNRTRGALEFLTEQTNRLRSSLARSEEELRDAKNAAKIASLEGRSDMLMKEWEQLQSGLNDAIVAVAASEAEVQGLKTELDSLPATEVSSEMTGVGDQGTDLMRGQFYSVQLKEHELAAKYTDSYPELIAVRAESAAAKNTLDREERTRNQVTVAPSKAHEETHIAIVRERPVLESLRAKVKMCQDQLADVERQVQSFNTNELRLRSLEREIGIQDSEYRKYSENLEQERIDEALEAQRISNISVAQSATCAPKPVRPQPMLYLLAGLALGLFGGIGTAFMAEFLDGSLKTAKELEATLGLPNLASIPRLSPKQMAFTLRN